MAVAADAIVVGGGLHGCSAALHLAQRSGFSSEDFNKFVAEYEGLNIIQVNPSRTRIDLAGERVDRLERS